MNKNGLTTLVLGLSLLSPLYTKAAEVEVKMLNVASDGGRGFEPALVHINPGDSVHFVAFDKGHSAESIPGMLPDGATPFAGKVSQDITVKFEKPGIYGYRCLPHYYMGMVGLIMVGTPVNEAATRNMTQPAQAKARFDQLFSALDAQENTPK